MITQLPEIITKLGAADRTLFDRLFLVSGETGTLKVPAELKASVEKQIGPLGGVEKQTIVKVTNRVTLETTIFNELRAKRPQTALKTQTLEELVEAERANDAFANPLTETSEDVFGRVEGEFSITGSNIAKMDVWHGLTIFKEFHPLKFSQEQVIDYLFTAREWAETAHQLDSKAIYYLFMWNCLWRSGSSIVHGHAQMCLGRDMHYGKIERLRRDALAYRERTKRNYFNDLVQIHTRLGLAADPADRVKALANLTPTRDREIILLTDIYSPELGEAIYKTLAYFKSAGVTSFNVAIQMPPIAPGVEDWTEFPVLARIVDRGNSLVRGNDVGSIDLFAANIASADPFSVAGSFRNWLRENH